jgi:hypothetical protein
MIFHVSFHLSDGTMSKSDSRRQVRLSHRSRIARCWHCAQGHKGFIIAESGDGEATEEDRPSDLRGYARHE